MVNPVMGLLADRLKKVQQFGAKPFGYENPPVEILMNLLGIPAVQQTMERMAYGEPLTTGSGMTTKPRPEAIEAAMTLLPASVGLAKATKGLPVGASIKNVGKFDVTKRDASEIFGEGAQRFKYTEPKSGGSIDVLARPDGTASVLELQVPDKFRGKGIGESLQKQVLQDFPDMQGQVSSKAAATTAYRLGRRPVDMPDATLKDVHKMIDEDSSVNMISPQMQQRISPSPSYPQQEALDTAQRNAVEYPLAPAGTRYEEFGGELTYMTPDEYLSRVRPLTLDAESLDNIAALKSHVQSGGQLDPLHIYQSGVEDGRHRAYMAKELGIEKIPVALHTEANNLGQNIPTDALSLLAEQKRKEITSLLDY